MKRLILLLTTCFLTFYSLDAQTREAKFSEWGKGLIYNLGENGPGLLKAVIDKVPVYHKPNGYTIGEVKGGEDGIHSLVIEAMDPVELQYQDFKMISYEMFGLCWFEEKDGFVRIGLSSYSGKQQFWLKRSDLEKNGAVVHDYVSFATTRQNTLFPERLGINLNFRTSPTTQSKVITTLNSNHYAVTPTGKSKGMWIEVKVTKYSEKYCEGGELENEWTGWIKFIDDQGYPNIWFYAKGC